MYRLEEKRTDRQTIIPIRAANRRRLKVVNTARENERGKESEREKKKNEKERKQERRDKNKWRGKS